MKVIGTSTCDCGVVSADKQVPDIPGRELQGTYLAMQYLPLQNRRNAGDEIPEGQFISAAGKKVVILGGGDTGADCLGTALRQGAASVNQFEILPKPPEARRTQVLASGKCTKRCSVPRKGLSR